MTFPRRTRATAVAVALSLVAAGAAGAWEVVRAGYGSLTIGGLAQAAWIYHLGDDVPAFTVAPDGALVNPTATPRETENEFVLQRLRLRFSGEIVSDKVRYFTQGEFDGTNARLLDARISLGYLPYTWLHVGRWAPGFTFFSEIEPEDIFFADYPLMDEDPYGHALHRFRDLGLELAVDLTYVEVRAALLNGQDPTVLEGDNNSAKDYFFAVIGRPPVRGLRFRASFRQAHVFDRGESATDADGEFKEENDTSQDFGGGVWFAPRYGPIAIAEVVYRTTLPAEDDQDERNLLTWYAIAGFDFWYTTGLPVQLVGRYDFLDPDTNEPNDDYAVVTAAFNYSFEGPHARIAVNYVRRMERFEVERSDGKTRTGFDDDEIRLQVQVAF